MERLAGIDASFLYMETPQVHMHVGFACILDPGDSPEGYDFDAVVKHVEERASCHRVFRRRLARVPFDLHHPLWVDDPDFDLIHHMHRVALPAPGGPEEFGAMIGRISSSPLDRSKPLWEIWIIEGLEGGRLGLSLRMHHSVVDGVSGAGILMHLFDKSPTTIAPPIPLPPEPDKVPSDLELFAYAARSRVKQPVEVLRTMGQTVKKATGLLRDMISERRPAGTRPLGAPRTPFNGSVSPRRNLATMRLSVGEIREIKNALLLRAADFEPTWRTAMLCQRIRSPRRALSRCAPKRNRWSTTTRSPSCGRASGRTRTIRWSASSAFTAAP